MTIKVQYKDDAHRAEILEANKDKFLIEEQNLLDGNYLIFETEKPQPVIIYKDVPQAEIEAMQKALDEILLGGGI